MAADPISSLARPLDDPADLDPLLERIGDARYVLLGEASHGTHEYYRWRAEISRRLIAERGFSFVAVEGDWPDCYELNRCVKHDPRVPDQPRGVLDSFDRWPAWMWANHEVAAFADWLRGHNADRMPSDMTGFYGLDVYSLWESMRAILDYLSEHEPQHVEAAMQAWRCFEPYGGDPQQYARATRIVPTSCENAVIGLLVKLRDVARESSDEDDPEARFNAEQNAEVAAGAERYYRAMVGGGGESWNVRDRHMTDTLDRLMRHHGPDAKAIVWEHNTHIGDARATDMADAGMVNVGQLVRERHGDEQVVLVGFGGYAGSVIAGASWGAPMEHMLVPPARKGSVEALLHEAGSGPSLFVFPSARAPSWLHDRRDHRAIGVVFDPRLERSRNYVPTVLGQRYDAFCFFDDTEALHPLMQDAAAASGELDLFPVGR